MERHEQLLTLLRRNGGASVDDLSAELGVSHPTIRRDLRHLAELGSVVRTYGGAVPSIASPGKDPATGSASAAKQRIGEAAASLIEDGETLAISSGTTTLAVARHLVDRRDLTVITNALDIAQVLVDRPGIELIVLGGVARPFMHSLLGHLTELAVNELRADRLVMGIAAFDEQRGLTNDYMPEVLTDRALARVSNHITVVADSSKYGRVAPAHVFPMSTIDVIVSDSDLPDAGRQAIERADVELILA